MSVEGLVKILKSDMGPGMNHRYADKAFFYALQDAIKGKDDVELVGQNVFRPEIDRPVVDDFIMDEEVVLDILRKMGHREPV